MKIILVLSITFIVTGLIMIIGCSSLGGKPDKRDSMKFSKSPQYNLKTGKFENRVPGKIKEMNRRISLVSSVKDWLKNENESVPAKRLPEETPDLDKFMEPSEELKVIWFGHSTLLLNLDGKTVLIDPIFSKSAGPVSFLIQRFQSPVLEMEELPEIDYVLISHDHFDHLDMNSIKFFKDKKAEFIVPMGVDVHLRSWGIQANRIVTKDWWDSFENEGLKFTATPAQHFSGRRGVRGNETLWASWVIQSKNHKVYYSGDSGYDIHFKEIGDRLGPFDIAFMETGQYNEKWIEVHMLPEEGVKAAKELRAEKYFPVHWGMFELSLHAWNDPIKRVYKADIEGKINLVAPKIGEVISTDQYKTVQKWWRMIPITKKEGNVAILEKQEG